MDENNDNVRSETESAKVRKPEETAAEKKAKRKLLKEEAVKKEQSIADMKKQIAEMEKKIKQEKRALQKSRNSVRSHGLIVIAVDLIAAMELKEKEAKCVTDDDYKILRSLAIRKVKSLMIRDKTDFGYDDLVFALGFEDEKNQCGSDDDYKLMNKRILEKVKSMMIEDYEERKKEQ